jgi:di/tricarboxylate transporter
MTPHIAITLTVLFLAAILFISGRLRVDLVALLVLGSLALTGLVTPGEALAGFSSPAVVTVWAMFIISGGLSKTGVANLVGRQVLRLAGQGEGQLTAVIMLTAGTLSAFMNNVGVAAMMLPVVMDITHRLDRPPSKLLMPLATGSLLGGLTTLIGTPPNILVSDALRDHGLRPFQLFDFTPVGLVVMLAGVAFVALAGRHLLPARNPARESAEASQRDLGGSYELEDRLFVIRLPLDSPLAGKTLTGSRLGAALRLNVVAIIRNGQTRLAPRPDVILRSGDRLLVQGRQNQLAEWQGRPYLVIEPGDLALPGRLIEAIGVAEVQLSVRSPLVGQTLYQGGLRGRFGLNVLAIRRGAVIQRANLQDTPLQPDDTLLLQGPRPRLETLQAIPDFASFRLISDQELAEVYHWRKRFIALRIPPDSILAGQTLTESRLEDAFGLMILGLVRDGSARLMPEPEEPLQAGDILLVKGEPEELATLHGLQNLEIESQPPSQTSKLESEGVGLAEVVLSPHTTLTGKTLRQLHFREKYGLSVLAIWREGRPSRAHLRDMPLRFGDALLLYGPREKLSVLAGEPDFLVLTHAAQEPLRLHKAPLAVLVLVTILLPVLLGWLPIAIAAVVGATLMVLTGSLTMEEAYRFIEWRAVFLIAGMLPLGIAMQQSGAASFLAEGMVSAIGELGPLAIVAGLFILTALAAQVMPTTAVAVLMAPIALNTAANLGLSPYALMMTIALAASASFMSPVAHPANILVMGPGGYRFTDYIKVGLPLTLVILLVVLLVLPIFWPLSL